jgi:hypothetical protein
LAFPSGLQRKHLAETLSPVRRIQKVMFILLLIVVVGFAIVKVAIRTSEPMYQAHTLSHWLELYSNPSSDAEEIEARNAVLAIGSNAVPYLLKNLRHDIPDWKKKLTPKPGSAFRTNELLEGFFFGDYQVATHALSGFEILGTNANSAVPELTAMLNNTNARRSQKAMGALTLIGSKGLPVLTNAFADTNRPNRIALIYHIGWMAEAVGTNAVYPLVTKALEDHDPKVRQAAERLVARFNQASNQAVEAPKQ